MSAVQLTAAGRVVTPIVERSQAELVNTWRREFQAMLVFAASLRKTHERIMAMEEWLDGHDTFDAKYDERLAQFQREHGTYLEQASRLADWSDCVNALQRRLSVETIESLERAYTWPIADHLPQSLAIFARTTGVSDFETVLEAFHLDSPPF